MSTRARSSVTHRGFAIMLQLTTLAFAVLLASISRAQDIAGKTQLGLGLGLISYVKTTQSLEIAGIEDAEASTTSFGTLESSTIRLGYGASNEFVLSLDVSMSLQTDSQDDTEDVTTTSIALAPVASYVFPGSTVRPFLLGSVGIVSVSAETGDIESSTTLFGFTGGVGIHWFASESVSLSPTLSLGYFFGSTTFEGNGPAIEGDGKVLSVGLGFMLAAWL